MFAALWAVKQPFKAYLKHQEITTDNVLFRVHTILTAAILLCASILLTMTQLIGNPIECYSGTLPEKWQHAINTYCWVKGSFTMPTTQKQLAELYELQQKGYNPQLAHLQNYHNPAGHGASQYLQYNALAALNPAFRTQLNAPYPGIIYEFNSEGPKKFYPYYQWVCFILFFQAMLCYLPKALWNIFEGGLMSKLATGLHSYCPSEERAKKTDNIICYMEKYRRRHKHYAVLYWGCEVLCFVNIILQMWMMDKFLSGEFMRIGIHAVARANQPQDERFDPLIYIFPRMTKCNFEKYGPSGDLMNLDSLCVLPQNILNEKIYIFIWFWYSIMALLFILLFVYRLLIIFLPSSRPMILAVRSRLGRAPEMFSVAGSLDLGDWWLLYMLTKNMNPLIYRDFIKELARSPDNNKKRLYPDIKYMGLDTVDAPKKPLE